MQSPVIQNAPLPNVATVLVICAYPDDMESWCGGTLAHLVQQGADVSMALVAAGDTGSADRSVTPDDVAATRLAEPARANERLGLTDLRFLDERDGEVDDTLELGRKIVELIREVRPDVIFSHDPEHVWPPYITHRDHRIVGRAVLDAVYPMARDHLFFPAQVAAGLEPHIVSQVWMFSTSLPTTAIDITATLDLQIDARLEHASQTSDPAALRTNWRAHATAIGTVPARRSRDDQCGAAAGGRAAVAMAFPCKRIVRDG
ncbi:MAG: PIG-L family deacetylase [Thermomicrobiales bacterium]|nr:PIG-L family deacetylase [Thermomicrobiales bacterium]